jgi:hypothetical protein
MSGSAIRRDAGSDRLRLRDLVRGDLAPAAGHPAGGGAGDGEERKTAFDRELAAALGEERHAKLVRLLTEALPIVTAMERGN